MEKTNVTKLTKELTKALKDKPDYIRKGQFVFNYIETVYGVASVIQFEDKIDCFYDDSKIPDFILACIKRINNQNRIKMEEKLINVRMTSLKQFTQQFLKRNEAITGK